MESSREKMIGFLERAAEIPCEHAFFAEPRPYAPLEYNAYRHPFPRIFLPLSGIKRVGLATGGQIISRELMPGTALFGHNGAWVKEYWNSEHEMICLIYFRDMVRTLYIHHNGKPPEQSGPDVYFHTTRPLAAPAEYVLRAIEALADASDTNAAPCLISGLLRLTLQELRYEGKNSQGKAVFTWSGIKNYLQENLTSDLSREAVAKKFKLHPSHLSKLASRHAGMNFNAYVNNIRMEHAATLLSRENLTVDEAAVSCGFKYTSYFIRVFHRYFHMAPGIYREQSQRKSR